MSARAAPPASGRTLVRQLAAQPGARLALVVVGLLLVVAATADLIASDKPLVVRLQGETHWLANLRSPAALQGHTTQTLLATLAADEWLVATPVPWGINEQDKGEPPLAPPSRRHLLGTDTARRDVLARLVHGTRVTLLVGLVAVLISVGLGTLLGLSAGYFGGLYDALVCRAIEAVMTIPTLFLLLAVMAVLEHIGVVGMMVIIGLTMWTRVARLVRVETMRVRQLEYVLAAEALGLSRARIMLRHVLPNVASPIYVAAAFGLGSAVLVEAALSFLGFGAPDTTATWGGLLHGAQENFFAWWLVLFPGAAIFATVTAYNLLGEALRDALDPRLTPP